MTVCRDMKQPGGGGRITFMVPWQQAEEEEDQFMISRQPRRRRKSLTFMVSWQVHDVGDDGDDGDDDDEVVDVFIRSRRWSACVEI